jgi:hypothetical protein
MELLADRDPEEARTLLDPVLEKMMEAVHRYEGTVNQVMGDGIMALFGAPLALEKDSNSNRITRRGRAQAGVLGVRAGTARALAGTTWGQSTVVDRDDRRVSGQGLGEPGKARPSSPREGLGKTQPALCAGLPAHALVEDELGHGRRGLIPVG